MKLIFSIPVLLILLFDALPSFSQDNKTISNKAGKLISELKSTDEYPYGGRDTLIDLNGDGDKDLLIEFYYLAGTGLKNGIEVFLYNKKQEKFINCNQLNMLRNPTFYFDKKIVTGYYIALGGGHASKLKWNGLKLDTLQYIQVEIIHNPDPKFKIKTTDYPSKKTTIEFYDSMTLPDEYNYFAYKPIIKNKD